MHMAPRTLNLRCRPPLSAHAHPSRLSRTYGLVCQNAHLVNSVKVAKLTKAAKVYRGISGGMLPEEFWTPNQQGIRGGVESAFMSTTYDRSVAMHYASQPGKPSLLFEMQMGMVDRGCELDWISQYPH